MRGLAVMALALLSTSACAREARESPDRSEAATAAAPQPSESAMDESDRPGGAVAGLPYARGKTFASLDEYLAHLEKQGAIDLPYWRQIGPGLYEWTTSRRPAPAPERATRAELMARYGFTR